MRLHVLMFAALAGTALFPLPYAPKVADFVAALGMPPPPPVTADSVGSLLAAVDRAWDLRERDGQPCARVADLQDRSRRTLEIATRCLRAATLGRAAVS
jgi:polysaccharide pyruvyl transferase WcaK-like protein